jgi:hypothetical protein
LLRAVSKLGPCGCSAGKRDKKVQVHELTDPDIRNDGLCTTYDVELCDGSGVCWSGDDSGDEGLGLSVREVFRWKGYIQAKSQEDGGA